MTNATLVVGMTPGTSLAMILNTYTATPENEAEIVSGDPDAVYVPSCHVPSKALLESTGAVVHSEQFPVWAKNPGE